MVVAIVVSDVVVDSWAVLYKRNKFSIENSYFIVWNRILSEPYERYTLNICFININPLYLTGWVEQPDRALQFKVKAIVKLQLVEHVTEYAIYQQITSH